ncbi:MAG TPA: hypothetical protein PLB11_15275, partial [Flavobacterium sp.]|nr:hypothetical protein [Flavobacterium sp.]
MSNFTDFGATIILEYFVGKKEDLFIGGSSSATTIAVTPLAESTSLKYKGVITIPNAKLGESFWLYARLNKSYLTAYSD